MAKTIPLLLRADGNMLNRAERKKRSQFIALLLLFSAGFLDVVDVYKGAELGPVFNNVVI